MYEGFICFAGAQSSSSGGALTAQQPYDCSDNRIKNAPAACKQKMDAGTDTDFKPRCLKATIEEELSGRSSVSYQRRGHDQLFAAKVPESRKVEGDVGEDHQVLDEGEQGVDWRDRADRSVYPSYSSDEESVFTPSP